MRLLSDVVAFLTNLPSVRHKKIHVTIFTGINTINEQKRFQILDESLLLGHGAGSNDGMPYIIKDSYDRLKIQMRIKLKLIGTDRQIF